jgi:hypothetical protein
MRFTIRDLLWLMVVVALGLMWWREYRENIGITPSERAFLESARQSGYEFSMDGSKAQFRRVTPKTPVGLAGSPKSP